MSLHRRTARSTYSLAAATALFGVGLSHWLKPDWPEINHALLAAGGQLLALGGLCVVALNVNSGSNERVRTDQDGDCS